MEPIHLIIIILSVIWLVVTGSAFAVYIAVKPYREADTWKGVVIGVIYSFIGGLGFSWVGLDLVQEQCQAVTNETVFWLLLIPWTSFLITGPIMIGMQIEKHKIEAWVREVLERSSSNRRQLTDD